MNNQSPLIPQGSNVEQKNQNRSRIKFAVMGVIAVNVVFFAALLVVGCKREQNAPPIETAPLVDTNLPSMTDTNLFPVVTNAPVALELPFVAPPAAATTEYKIKSGDTLTSIASHHGTTVKALRAANALTTDKIKVGQKLKIPVKASAPAPALEPVIAAPAPAPMSVPTPAPVR